MINSNFKKEDKVFLVYCPKCKRENYAFNVAVGLCAWCGYDANADEDYKKQVRQLKRVRDEQIQI
jgi:ribosomal protein L37E